MPSRNAATLYPGALALSCLLALVQPSPVSAQAVGQAVGAVAYDIGAGPLDAALNQFSAQSSLQLAYPPELVAGKTTSGLSGPLVPEEALRRLLRGTGLTWDAVNDSMYVLKRAPDSSNTEGLPVPAPATGTTLPQAEAQPLTLASSTVTGTRIRGGSVPSPVTTISSVQIQEEGFTDLGEVIRSLPQNFSGGQNPGVIPFTISGAGAQNQNVTGGSTLNLRGLGPDATLTLLNGRRMAYGGFSQAVDIGAIPVEAVERVEIVADGSSAIYGSDAVGGVGNVVLKRDFEGVALGALYGGATDGGLTTNEYSATAGATWSGGGLIATFKDVSTDPIYAKQRDYTDHLIDRYTIYPASDLRSGLLSAYHPLGAIAELRVDAFRTERSQSYGLHDNPNNAFVQATPDTTTSLVSPGVDFFLTNDWTVSVGGVWSKSDHHQFQQFENLSTGVIIASLENCYCNDLRMYEVGMEGPLFSLLDGEARIALGAGHRTNQFSFDNYVTETVDYEGDDKSRFAYVELDLPLIRPDSGAAWAQRFSLTAAARAEDYDSFGNVTTPKVGVVYGPVQDFTMKASWGRSFKAPTLTQRYYQRYALVDVASYWGASGDGRDDPVLVLGGGNPDLGPERARTSTLSVAFHPQAVPRLDMELTWFDIDYTDRVTEPLTAPWLVLSNAVYEPFVVRSPTEQQQTELVAAAGAFYDYFGAPYDSTDVAALIYAQYVNVARQKIRGLDLAGSYSSDLAAGQLTVRGSASWLDSSQQSISTQDPFNLSGTLHNSPKISGRLGAVWAHGGLTASAFANHKSGVRTMAQDEKTASFTTLDATLRYATGGRGGARSGWDVAVSVQNLLDRDPPLHSITSIYFLPPYDATNYSAVGRYMSVSVSKLW